MVKRVKKEWFYARVYEASRRTAVKIVLRNIWKRVQGAM